MDYTVILNGQSYDLPKKTMSVWTELDNIFKLDLNKTMPLRNKYKIMYDFIGKLIGYEKLVEVFTTTNIDEIDLNEITLTIKKIKNAYDEPLKNYEIGKSLEAINSLPLDKLAGLKDLVIASKNQEQ